MDWYSYEYHQCFASRLSESDREIFLGEGAVPTVRRCVRLGSPFPLTCERGLPD